MKKILIPVLALAAFLAFNEQNKPKPNVYITVGAVVVFMFGMMKISSKIPPKDDQNDNNTI